MSVSAKLINSLITPSQVIYRSSNTSSSFNLFKYCLRIEFLHKTSQNLSMNRLDCRAFRKHNIY